MKLSALQQHTGLALHAKPTTDADPTKSPDTPKLTATGLDAFEKTAPTPSAPAPSQVRSGGRWKLPFANLTEAGITMVTQEGIKVTAEQLSEGVTSKITGGDSVLNAFVNAFSDYSEDKGAIQTARDSVRDLFINFSQDGKFALNTELIKQMKFSAKSLQPEFELDLIKMANEFLKQEAANPPTKFTLNLGLNFANSLPPKAVQKPSMSSVQEDLLITGLSSLINKVIEETFQNAEGQSLTPEKFNRLVSYKKLPEGGVVLECEDVLNTGLTSRLNVDINNFLISKGLVKDFVKDAGYESSTNYRSLE